MAQIFTIKVFEFAEGGKIEVQIFNRIPLQKVNVNASLLQMLAAGNFVHQLFYAKIIF